MRREGGISDGVYSTVKSFASKGTILPRTGLETLAEAKELDDLAGRLKGTLYGDAVSRVARPYSAQRFEMAFREYLAQMHSALMHVTPKPDLLISYYLKHIVWNLKTVLKGKALGMTYDQIIGHVNLYAEELAGRRDLVVKALSAKDLDEAASLLEESEFGDDIDSAVELYKSKRDIQILDTYIDKALYKSLVSSYNRLRIGRNRISPEAGRVRPMVAIDVDSFNVLSLLRAQLWDLTPSETRDLIIEPVFDIPSRTLESLMSAGNIGEAVKRLAATPYRRIIPSGVNEEELIPKLENEFEMIGYEEALKSFLWQVYGMGVVLGIVKLRELEVRNLSAIAFGVEQGLGYQNIMSKLLILA